VIEARHLATAIAEDVKHREELRGVQKCLEDRTTQMGTLLEHGRPPQGTTGVDMPSASSIPHGHSERQRGDRRRDSTDRGADQMTPVTPPSPPASMCPSPLPTPPSPAPPTQPNQPDQTPERSILPSLRSASGPVMAGSAASRLPQGDEPTSQTKGTHTPTCQPNSTHAMVSGPVEPPRPTTPPPTATRASSPPPPPTERPQCWPMMARSHHTAGNQLAKDITPHARRGLSQACITAPGKSYVQCTAQTTRPRTELQVARPRLLEATTGKPMQAVRGGPHKKEHSQVFMHAMTCVIVRFTEGATPDWILAPCATRSTKNSRVST